jgi:hypothetical protein
MSKRLFLSHESKAIIEVTKFRDLLLEIAPHKKQDIFMAGDGRSMEPGEPWFARLLREIKSGAELWVLITRVEALSNPWINFEIALSLGVDRYPKILVFGGIHPPQSCPIAELRWIGTGITEEWQIALEKSLEAKIDSDHLYTLGALFKQAPDQRVAG